jgi:alkanesulfonate monooxygenase SsuD/methylene tetrahydromethanopterin reductase-like flavin-dependent oxidoreductase (luciferase family)
MPAHRVGFATGYDPHLSARDMAAFARRAEQLGYEIGFFSETVELMRDSVSSLAAMVLATERLTIGATQIVRLRSPLVMAQTMATLDEMSGGRMVLAPGACTASHSRRYGLHHVDPPTSLREWVEIMRRLLAGETFTYEGETITVHDVEMGWEPVRPAVPMWIPATSTTGLRLAGQLGDGVLLNAICSPEYTINALRIVREAVEKAGRDWSTYTVAQLINCSVEDDPKTAIDAIRWEVASKFDPVQLPFIAGPKMRVGEPYIQASDIPVFENAWKTGGREALIKAIPDSYVTGMTASGTPDQVLARVQEYRDAGVHLPILRPAAEHQTERLLQLFASPDAVKTAL